MRNDNDQKTGLILSICGIVPVVWLSLLTAPYVSGGIVEIVSGLSVAVNNPFSITVCEDSVKTVLIFLLAYAMGIGIYFSTRRNYRRREEHGSAKWGNAKAVNKKYSQNPPSANKIMTQNVRIGLNAKKHRRNLNTLCCGGSGAGKTRFFCKINAMQANTSFVILDPKGEIVRDVGKLLEKKGFEIRVLDLISMEKSHCYNPFVYLRNDNDIQRLVTNLFKSTTPKGSQSNDPFWDTAASMLLLALVFYLHYEAPEEEQNFPMVMEMLRAGEVREDDDSYQSPLDELFDRLEPMPDGHAQGEPLYKSVCFDRMQRYRALKQADLVQLMALFPEDFSDGEKRAVWDRYEPLTVHDSSLSFGIHALLAFRLGLEKVGWRYFERSLCFDLSDELGNTGREGIHMAALGASWQALVYGALGLWSDGGQLRLSPRLPPEIRGASLCVYHRGRRLRLTIKDGQGRIEKEE